MFIQESPHTLLNIYYHSNVTSSLKVFMLRNKSRMMLANFISRTWLYKDMFLKIPKIKQVNESLMKNIKTYILQFLFKDHNEH